MSLSFIRTWGGGRLESYSPQPVMFGDPADAEDGQDEAELDYEVPRDEWTARDLNLPVGWEVGGWPDRPVRFIDGKDVGETVTCLTAPAGHPVPVRLSNIGGVSVRIVDGACRREEAVTERLVTLCADGFPADEVEAFGIALQANGMRLAKAEPPNGQSTWDLEPMRKAAQNKSNDEMGQLEEEVLAHDPDTPTIVDGRLEPRVGGFDPASQPVFGVVKTHRKNYLHPLGMQVLYRLGPGQRTPVFELPNDKLKVHSWYLRIAGGPGTMPNWGIVRIEIPSVWFVRNGADMEFVDRLSATVLAWRSRERSYVRAPVSLHPIVRAEELLGALFTPHGMLANRFYHLAGL